MQKNSTTTLCWIKLFGKCCQWQVADRQTRMFAVCCADAAGWGVVSNDCCNKLVPSESSAVRCTESNVRLNGCSAISASWLWISRLYVCRGLTLSCPSLHVCIRLKEGRCVKSAQFLFQDFSSSVSSPRSARVLFWPEIVCLFVCLSVGGFSWNLGNR